MFTPGSNLPEPDFLKTLLQPLLEDFQYWFGRSQKLLESHQIDFLSPEQQSSLLTRVQQAQQEVSTTQLLFNAMDGQAGIETAVLVPWHQLVTECWQVGMKFRMEHPELAALEQTAELEET
ncbi:MAG: DUF2605 domain-containing protein [Pegethrix bostrychoides GSE-TBD4-15B]|jgi:hypothetical protein|uniref:DUF2605 domain-containing protein n=1 Tax=Pegethrix bostrychoides GSE-TBD4-15B TaxID=2839662 RepID=A0A951PBY8_9CYAN|nr:DUF2605 domain-containing protein [Pegethrix bostrychoides GSE-TBD4-15B]